MTIAFYVLVLLIVIVAAIDLYPQLMEWQSRIKIGRWKDRALWADSVLDKSISWLRNTPAVKLRDNSRLIIIDILKGNYKRKSIQNWQQAALFLGLSDGYAKTGDDSILQYLQGFLSSKINEKGWKQKPADTDIGILGYAFIEAKWLDKRKFRPAFDELYDFLQSMKGTDGTIMYRKHTSQMRYVDTIGFVSPFLVKYGLEYGNDQAIEDGCRQILEFNKFGMYPNGFIPCHSYNIDTKLTAGLFGWGRGLAWYAIGLIDSWRALPDDHQMKKLLEGSVVEFAMMALRFQNSKGGWNWLVMNPNSVTESSATSAIAYFLSHAEKIPEISEACAKARDLAVSHLMKVTKRDGAIDMCQGDTKDIGVYSQEFGILPFAQGFALRTFYNLR